MFGIKRLRQQIEELQKEVYRLAENQSYYDYSSNMTCGYQPWPGSDLYPYSSSGPCASSFSRSLRARDVLDRFDELYAVLNLERKTIPGTETTVKL